MNKRYLIGGMTAAFAFGIFVAWSIVPLFREAVLVSSTKVLARDGSLLYEVSPPSGDARTFVPYDRFPSHLIQALVTAEDERFFQHHGVDAIAVFRALKDRAMGYPQSGGASTIEQQLVKNVYFPHASRSILQKAREMVAARYWSLRHTKEETLEAYANTVYFGNAAYGVQKAAQTYFHKDVSDLNLAESAMLAGIIPAPSSADPYRHRSVAVRRQREVLDRMTTNAIISPSERDIARATDVSVFAPKHEIKAPHFVFRVLEEVESRIPDIRNGGYIIRTTLDPALLRTAEEVISRRLLRLSNLNVTNGAALIVDTATGDVLAHVGSAEYLDESIDGQVDMTTAPRQPGSALKPFLVFEALRTLRATPATVIADLPVRFENEDGSSYYPRNYSYRYYGPVTVRDALGSSLNIPAVKLLDQIGVEAFVGVLERFGIRFPQPASFYGRSIVLGGGEVTLEDMVSGYADLSRYASHLPLRRVLEIADADGRVIETASPSQPRPLYDDPHATQASALVADILSDKLARSRAFGEASLMEVSDRVAVKTGTTRNFTDNWAFGYTPEWVVGVWVGNADGSPMQGVSGNTGAVPMWHDLAEEMLRRNKTAWPDVQGISARDICLPSGLLATDRCLKKREEHFIEGTEPVTEDDWYVTYSLDRRTGLVATSACPSDVITRVFLRPPSTYDAWMRATGYEAPPDRDCTGAPVQTPTESLRILAPIDGESFELEPLVDARGQLIPFVAGGSSSGAYRWTLNGKAMESASPMYLWEPSAGEYVLRLQGADGEVRFTVR